MKNILLLLLLLGSSTAWADFIRDDAYGTVTDTKTNLQWQDNTNTISYSGWATAINTCENLTLDGFSDWRLPNINELMSITDYNKQYNITVDAFRFTRSGHFWSSTTVDNSTKNAWTIDFEIGHSGTAFKTYIKYVRCVRTKN